LINVGHLKCILDAAQSSTFVLSLLSNVGASVVPWLSDDKRLLSDEEYNIAITPTYLAILSAIERASDDKAEILENYGGLLAAISTRITPGAPTFAAFVDFWQRVFGDHFDAEQAPSSLRALLLISGCKLGSESPESQEQEQVPETPVDTTEEEEWQEVSNALEALCDSDDSALSVAKSPVVLRSPIVNQSQSLPVFGETQTTEASDAGSSSISSDEGEEEVPVELPEPALVERLLRLRNSLSPSRMRRSQSRLRDVTISTPGDDPSHDDFSPAASGVTESPAKETQLEVSMDDQEGKISSPEDRVLKGSSPSPSSIKEHLFSPRSAATIVMLNCDQCEPSPSDSVDRLPTPAELSSIRTPVVAPLTTILGKKRGREDEQEQETPSKRRKSIELLARDGFFSGTDTEGEPRVEDSVEVAATSADVQPRPTLLEPVPESVVSPTVSPMLANKEILVEVEVNNLRCIEEKAIPISSKRPFLPDLRMKLMLLLATSLKRKREVEEVSKPTAGMSSSHPPETRSPRNSYGALEQPSPSKRRRLETWSDSPVLRVLLPSLDELSSSGMCFDLPFTMRAAHRSTQTMVNVKTFRDRTTR
jgi:hypothetical protein